MSNYTKLTNFTAKDSLETGDPNKLILGSEIDDEFDAIAVAVGTKIEGTQAVIGAALYPQTTLESSASAVPTYFYYKPYDVKRYGALGDNSNDDAGAARTAETIASGTTHFEAGMTCKMVPQSTSPFYFGNSTSALVYTAVQIDVSNHVVDGVGSTFHIVSRSSPASSDVQYCYTTDKNLTLGTQKHLTFWGTTVDTANNADAANSNHRGYYLTGVDGVRLVGTRGLSSGNRRGNQGNIQNSRNVQILGHFHYKNTQGFNFRYTQNVCVVGGVWYDFSECLDFDGTQNRSVVVGNTFESTNRVNQMIDCNGQVEAVFSGFTAYNLGQVVNISHKHTTPDNFSDYVNNVAAVALTPSQRIYVGAGVGSAIGSSSSTGVVISNDWSDGGHAGYDCTHDVVLNGLMFEDTGYWMIWECERLTIRDCYLGGVITATGLYAVDCRSLIANGDQRSWSTLSGLIDGLTINGSDRGGLRVKQPKRFGIRNVTVRNINTSGSTDFAVQIQNLEERGGQIIVDGLDIDGTGNVNISGNSTLIAAWAATTTYRKSQIVSNGGRYYRATSETGVSAGAGGPTGITAAITDGTVTWEYISEPFSVYWGPTNKLGAGSTIVFGGDAHKYTHGRMYGQQLGDLAATGTVSRMLYTASRKCYVARALITNSANVAVDAANYRTFAFKSLTNLAATTTTISTVNTQAGLTAYVPADGGFAINEVGAYLEPGDSIYVDISHSGTGAALTGLLIQLDVLEC